MESLLASPCCRLPALSALAAAAFAVAYPAIPARAADQWLGMYFQHRKIGYTGIQTGKTTYRGAPATRTTTRSVTRLEMFGQTVRQDIDTELISDTNGRPIHQEFRMASTGSSTRVTAEYRATTISCTVEAGGAATRKEVAIPPGARIVGDTDSARLFQRNVVGQKTAVYALNPLTVTLDRSDAEVMARETVTLEGVERAAFRVTTASPMGQVISWETEDGQPIRAEAQMGIVIYAEPEAVARDMTHAEPKFAVSGAKAAAAVPAGGYTPPPDFAIGTSVAVDRDIPNPTALRTLTLELDGLDALPPPISDARQKAAPIAGRPGAYRFEIRAEAPGGDRSATLPLRVPPAMAALTRAATYLDTNDPAIRAAAAEARGGETSAYAAASRIRGWVHGHMRPDYSIGVPRSCVDILKNPRGVCRDYATLFVALARASGIPARVAGGIVYMGRRFYYHAWGECWVGRWVSLDPTRPTDFVDATHIKLVEGSVTEMYQIVNAIGRLKARILDAPSAGAPRHPAQPARLAAAAGAN